MTLEIFLIVTLAVALILYVTLAGADFGAGVWEFNLFFRPSPAERKLIDRAIAPVWEANHVWLIFVIVVVHTAFPLVFAALSRALFMPLLLASAGIVLRGAGFVLRYYGDDGSRPHFHWSVVFALASVLAPFFLGAAVGAVASGELPIDSDGRFSGHYLTGWINPLSVFMGFFMVGLCAYLAAVYLCRDAWRESQADQAEVWRKRAIAVGVVVGLLAFAGLALVAVDVPALRGNLLSRGWPLILLSAITGFGALAALLVRRFTLAVTLAAVAVATLIAGWMVAQYPLLVPPHLTISTASASHQTLVAMAWCVAAGTSVLAPSFVWLLVLFKARTKDENSGES
jgi:cytochrome d ubiquinol oxidase subunit II